MAVSWLTNGACLPLTSPGMILQVPSWELTKMMSLFFLGGICQFPGKFTMFISGVFF